MKGLGNIMQQAQKMQETLQKVHAEIALMEIIGESGGGLVRVVINGRYEVKNIYIEDSLLNEDKDMLEDMIAAAFNDASHKVDRTTQEKMSAVTMKAGINFPAEFLQNFQ